MSIANKQKLPTTWSLEQVKLEAQKALELFVERRLNEPKARYPRYVKERRQVISDICEGR